MSNNTEHCIITNQVDLILFEEGVFSPLNWLLREGYLGYRDYQNWRMGEVVYLEDYFKKEINVLILLLIQAQAYAKSQNLDITLQSYASRAGLQLHFCRSHVNEVIFSSIFEPPRDRIQMDLFFDSASVCLEVDLITAILEKKSDGIYRLLAQLKSSNTERYQQFLQLIALEKEIRASILSNDRKIALLQKTTPLAFEILGRFTHEFLTPLWHKLSVAIAGYSFKTEAPYLHLSYTAFKGFCWQQVLSSIETESNWTSHPVLLFRYAEACFKLDNEQQGIVNWFRLFISFSEYAEQMIEKTSNRMLLSDWQYFCELEPEIQFSLFPAWLVMKKPALAKNIMISDLKESNALQLIVALALNGKTEINETVICLRRMLRKQSPVLFDHYMSLNML